MQTRTIEVDKSYLSIVIASLIIALGAYIKIPLWFTPVPFTAQTLAVMSIGAVLGSRKGAMACLLYLFEGCIGCPIFAGGNSGLLYLAGATGGYLLSYPLEAFLMGCLLEKNHRFLALFIPCSIQLALGSLWLIPFVGIDHIFLKGFTPFITVEIIKAIMAIILRRSA